MRGISFFDADNNLLVAHGDEPDYGKPIFGDPNHPWNPPPTASFEGQSGRNPNGGYRAVFTANRSENVVYFVKVQKLEGWRLWWFKVLNFRRHPFDLSESSPVVREFWKAHPFL